MRVGLMGGSFDPIHLGHLRAAENARETLSLTEVLFVPAAAPPHKPTEILSPAKDRLAMVALATADNPAFVASDLELRRTGPSYTVDTLEVLTRERQGDELFLIVGSDTLGEMSTWREPDRIFSLSKVAVAERPGTPSPAAALHSERVVRVNGPGLFLSASEVRRRVREGLSIRYLLPDTVAEYIHTNGLYS
jgi:nicotinate-nucleotide adenylyltransferase